MILRCLILASFVLTAEASLLAQQIPSVSETRIRAEQELEAVISEAKNLDNKLAVVTVRTKAATLVSFSHSVRADSMFLEVWKFVNEQTDSNFDKQQAKLIVLKNLFPRNPKLARQLLTEQTKPDQTEPANRDNDQRIAQKLASQLVDLDPAAAASLLEKSLSISPGPAGVGALTRLRERDSFLSDYVATKVLESLTTQPTAVSLPALHLLTAYVFPGPEAPISSSDAESSLQLLQFKYFLTGYELLRSSIQETNEALLKDRRYTQRDLWFRAVAQGQVAAILAALAPRFQPLLTVELTQIANKLASQVPQNISDMAKLALDRLRGTRPSGDDPEQAFAFSLSNGDFDEALAQSDRIKDDKKREIYRQLVFRNQARALLAKAEVTAALISIRKIDDPTNRLIMYLQALKATKKKRDQNLTNLIVNEARPLIPQTDRNGLHVRALLSFVAQLTDPAMNDVAMEFLNNAVVSINALANRTEGQSANKTLSEAVMIELNDPISLLDAPEMEQAFSYTGSIDLDRGLAQAKRIDIRPVQLAARLETLQEVLKRSSNELKLPGKPNKVASNPNQ